MTRARHSGGSGVFGMGDAPRQTPFRAFKRLSPKEDAEYIFTDPSEARTMDKTVYEADEETFPPDDQRQVFIPEQTSIVTGSALFMKPGEVFSPDPKVSMKFRRGHKGNPGMIGFKRATGEVLDQRAETYVAEDLTPYPSDFPEDIRPVGPYELPEGTPYVEDETSAEGIDTFEGMFRISDVDDIGQSDAISKVLDQAKKIGINIDAGQAAQLVKAGGDIRSMFKKPKAAKVAQDVPDDEARRYQEYRRAEETPWGTIAMVGAGVIVLGVAAYVLMRKS